MNSRNRTMNDAASAALDRLVLSEIRAFRREWLREREEGDSAPERLDPEHGESRRPRGERGPREANAHTRSWGDQFQGTEDRETPERGPEELSSSEVPGETQDQGGLVPEPGFDAESAEVLFGEEEERFIQDAVEWLSTRDNKDAVIARIWTLLNESDPEGFYSPSSEDLDSQGETGADGMAGEDQGRLEQ